MIKVIGSKVLVKNVDSVEKTESGIYIPDGVQEKPAEGEVISIGLDVEEILVGDHVYYGKYSGTEIKPDNETYIVMDKFDILAIKR